MKNSGLLFFYFDQINACNIFYKIFRKGREHIYHFINVDEGCFAVMYINYGLSYLFYRFELSTDFVPGKSSIFVG